MNRTATVGVLVAVGGLCAALLMSGCGGGGGATEGQTGTLGGTVTTDASAPIAGAAVVATGTAHTYTTTTATDGSYSFTLTAGAYDVAAGAAGYQSQTSADVAVTAGQTTTVNFALAADTDPPGVPATLGGLVTNDSTGAPLAGVVVTATDQSQGGVPAVTTTGTDGRYGFWLASGTYAITVTPPTGYTAPTAQTVTLSLGVPNLAVDFALTPQ